MERQLHDNMGTKANYTGNSILLPSAVGTQAPSVSLALLLLLHFLGGWTRLLKCTNSVPLARSITVDVPVKPVWLAASMLAMDPAV